MRVACSPDGRFVAGVGANELKVWDLATRAEAFAASVEGTVSQHLGFTPDGRQLTHLTFGQRTGPIPSPAIKTTWCMMESSVGPGPPTGP